MIEEITNKIKQIEKGCNFEFYDKSKCREKNLCNACKIKRSSLRRKLKLIEEGRNLKKMILS
jgi:predicted RNA-binding Zn ribbon-like protein